MMRKGNLQVRNRNDGSVDVFYALDIGLPFFSGTWEVRLPDLRIWVKDRSE